MTERLRPGAALDPETLESWYRGGLALEEEHDRLAACYVILLAGRLGLTPGELQHLHEGWIDWERGELRIPEAEPCACSLCWEHARVAQRRGDPRPLAHIVADGHLIGTPRAVPFGWSNRLTGVLATGLDTWEYLGRSAEELRRLLAESARHAAGVDAQAVDLAALRASAAQCLADVGLGARAIATTVGIDVEAAAAFTDRSTDHATIHLAETFGRTPPTPPVDGEEYPLVAVADPLPSEPFDSSDYDAAWRRERAVATEGSDAGPPRPAVVPDGIDAGPLDVHDGTESLAQSAGEPPADERTEQTATDGADGGSDEPADPAQLLTSPARLTLHTRFAASSLLQARPSGGRAMLGQSELVLAVHGGGRIKATVRIPFSAVTDVAFEWAPDRLAEVFDTTIGIAFDQAGNSETAVVELPEGTLEDFTAAFFEGLLGDVTALVKHPAALDGQLTDAAAQRCVLGLCDGHIEIAPSPQAAPTASIPVTDVIDVESDTLTLDADQGQALRLEHLEPGRQPVETILAPSAERDYRLLERYLRWDQRRRKRAATDAALPTGQKDLLEALHSTSGAKDLTELLGLDRTTLAERVEALAAAGFVHDSPDGVHLTARGMLRTVADRSERDA